MSKQLARTSPSSFWNLSSLQQRFTHKKGQGVLNTMPPQVIILLSIISVQVGAAFAKDLFSSIGPVGTVFFRLGFAALIFILVTRPRFRGYTRAEYLLLASFGVAVACMNLVFYASIARIPLGIAVTLEFVGPLGVSLFASRKRRDFLWASFAAVGVILLAPFGNTSIDPIGVGLALLAGLFWAVYILLNIRIGRAFDGSGPLALSMSIAAIVLLPFGIWSGGLALLRPETILLGIGVATLSTVIPYTLELAALRRLSARAFGILMSLEPAFAALVGFLILKEKTGPRALIALVLIVIASGGVSFFQQKKTDEPRDS